MNTEKLSERRQQLTKQFLFELELDRNLSKTVLNEEESVYPELPKELLTQEREKIKKQIEPFDIDVEEGQIRLLSQTEEETIVAVLKKWEKDIYLVAPYSRFSYPAIETELLTGRDTRGVRVLELWNARTIPYHVLMCSWVLDHMEAEEKEQAQEILELSLTGRSPTESVKENTGVPIFKPHDPRLKYKAEEIDKFSVIDAACERYEMILEGASSCSNKSVKIIEFPVEKTLEMAAASSQQLLNRIYWAGSKLTESISRWPKLPGKKLKAEFNGSFNPFDADKELNLLWDLSGGELFRTGDILLAWSKKNRAFIGSGVFVKGSTGNCAQLLFPHSSRNFKVESQSDLLLIGGR